MARVTRWVQDCCSASPRNPESRPHAGPRQPPAVSALGCRTLSWPSLAGVSRPCPSLVLSLSRVPRVASGFGLGVQSPLGQGPTQTPAGTWDPLSRQLRGPERTWGSSPWSLLGRVPRPPLLASRHAPEEGDSRVRQDRQRLASRPPGHGLLRTFEAKAASVQANCSAGLTGPSTRCLLCARPAGAVTVGAGLLAEAPGAGGPQRGPEPSQDRLLGLRGGGSRAHAAPIIRLHRRPARR